MVTIRIKSAEEMIELGKKIGNNLFPNFIIILNGDLGAGKTTFTKGIGKALKIKEIINSPTFTILKTYDGILPLYHMDCYRIENESDDFLLEEYFSIDGVTVVEWGDQIKSLLPKERLDIFIKIISNHEREVVINGTTKSYQKIEELFR